MATVQGHNLPALRQLNTRAVLAVLYESQVPLTLRELAELANVSRPTAHTTVMSLVSEGLAREAALRPFEARIGRPAKAFELNARRQVVVGLDVGPRAVVGRLADLRGETLAEERIEANLAESDAAFDAIARIVDRLLAETPFSRSQLAAISVGVPGVVDERGDIVLTTVVPAWKAGRIREKLAAAYDPAVVLFDNDTKLAAVAESRDGAARGFDDFVFLLLSDRIAASAFVNGQLFRGANGAAGEIGALGSLGWTTAYERYRSEWAYAGKNSDSSRGGASARLAAGISEGLAALCLSLDPQAVVIGGEPLQSDPRFMNLLRDELAAQCMFPPDFVPSSIPDNAVPYGAIVRALDHIRSGHLDAANSDGVIGASAAQVLDDAAVGGSARSLQHS